MIVSTADLFDRYSILMLKTSRLPENDSIQKEFVEYGAEVNKKLEGREYIEWLAGLLEVNSEIWDLESDIRRGKEGELGLEEVGRRALAIRDLNGQRIGIKNEISEFEGSFKEVKVDHASA